MSLTLKIELTALAVALLAACTLCAPTIARAQASPNAASATSSASTDQSASTQTIAPADSSEAPGTTAQPEVGAPVSAPATITAPSGSSSGTSASHHFWIGPELGAFFPTGKLSSRFGSTWLSIGIGFGSISTAPKGGQWGLDASIIGRSGSNQHAYFAPIGMKYRIALAQAGPAVPYVGVSGDLVLAEIGSPQDNVDTGIKTTGGGSVFVGTTLGRQAYLEARYLALGSVAGFNLSGLNLAAGFRF